MAGSDITASQVGLYAQDQISFGKFVATLGGRQDWVTMDTVDPIQGIDTRSNDSNFSGGAGLVYLADNGLAPMSAMGSRSSSRSASISTATPLKPETGEQWEIGVKYQPLDWNAFITVSAFDLTRSNLVRTDTNGDPFQTGEVRSRGIEVEAVASLADGLSLRAAYTYLDTEITNDVDPANIGNTPYGVPRNKAGIWADYTFQSGAWRGFGFGGGAALHRLDLGRRRQHPEGAELYAGRCDAALRLEEFPLCAERHQSVRQELCGLLLQCGCRLLLWRAAQGPCLDPLPLVTALRPRPARLARGGVRDAGGPAHGACCGAAADCLPGMDRRRAGTGARHCPHRGR